ncbi:hypothetical protein GBM64_10870 [Enterococcus faecium]|nr:hypothetical protein GBM51_09745 [Enterococcus faecium]KAB7621780.1 hypothetical protein GBM64_10870 [Enterococcus faecium]MCZ1523658.1 hypothetical protein [Enterococcus faecium]MCZ1544880.1 hypothetical protein [Enterococcus faecium]MCZ1549126.1 hypothetical protein [Enterococcus faecium]
MFWKIKKMLVSSTNIKKYRAKKRRVACLFKQHVFHNQVSNYLLGSSSSNSFLKYLRSSSGSASVSSGS